MTPERTLSAISAVVDRTYSNRSNAATGARAGLGRKDAKIDIDFEIYRVGDRFAWNIVQAGHE